MSSASDDIRRQATAALLPTPSLLAPTPGSLPVSNASLRLRALADLSGSLSDPLGPEDAANLVEQKALSALGATSAVVVTLGVFPRLGPSTDHRPDRGAHPRLHVVHSIGLRAEVNAALDDLPLDAPVPFADVARLGVPLFLSSESELRRYPQWGTAIIDSGARSAAVVPVWANGELRGVLGLTWAEPRTFDDDERAFVITLGVMCAQAIMRAHLRSAEQAARAGERSARDEAERANRSKARFVATISHELRTPINAVMGYTALLNDEIAGPITAAQRVHLERMQASGSHLIGLVEDLLGYARVEAGHEVVHAQWILLTEVLEESLMLVRPIAEQKGLEILVEEPATQVALFTDRRKLVQVLTNVLANAVKFTQHGSIVVRVGTQTHRNAPLLLVEVEDPGAGIALVDQVNIFEPFWQLESSTPNAAGSTGLGLSVARQLARLLGGDVSLGRSTLGEGSTFVVTMPARFARATGP